MKHPSRSAVVVMFLTCIAMSRENPLMGQAPDAAPLVVPSRPETVIWGWFPIDRQPVLTIKSGQTVRIDTLSHAGSTQDENPVNMSGRLGSVRRLRR